MIKVRLSKSGAVKCSATIELALSAQRVWAEIRDLPRFAVHDFLHASFEVGELKAGAEMTITHRLGPFKIRRRGRILRWNEGVGYAFSDLSDRSPRSGFPHVFAYRIEPLAQGCALSVRIRGLWTTRYLPRWAARLWLKWVFTRIVQAIHTELLVCQLAKRVLWRRFNRHSKRNEVSRLPRARLVRCAQNDT